MGLKQVKNEYAVNVLLSCSCIVVEEIESPIFAPREAEWRHCERHEKGVVISKVGKAYQTTEDKGSG